MHRPENRAPADQLGAFRQAIAADRISDAAKALLALSRGLPTSRPLEASILASAVVRRLRKGALAGAGLSGAGR